MSLSVLFQVCCWTTCVATNITNMSLDPCMTFLMCYEFVASLTFHVTNVTGIWTFWGMGYHVLLQHVHSWVCLLTNCALKFFWSCMQFHMDIQSILTLVYLSAHWTGESPCSQTVNILYNYSRLHGVFFLYNSAVRHSYKNDTFVQPPRKKIDILPWCYSICHTLCQNSSTSDLFGIIYTSTRNTEINSVFYLKKATL
jgi:hypothetical protein